MGKKQAARQQKQHKRGGKEEAPPAEAAAAAERPAKGKQQARDAARPVMHVPCRMRALEHQAHGQETQWSKAAPPARMHGAPGACRSAC